MLIKSILNKSHESTSFFGHDPVGIKLLSRLRLHLSYLDEHKFRLSFSNTVNIGCVTVT